MTWQSNDHFQLYVYILDGHLNSIAIYVMLKEPYEKDAFVAPDLLQESLNYFRLRRSEWFVYSRTVNVKEWIAC